MAEVLSIWLVEPEPMLLDILLELFALEDIEVNSARSVVELWQASLTGDAGAVVLDIRVLADLSPTEQAAILQQLAQRMPLVLLYDVSAPAKSNLPTHEAARALAWPLDLDELVSTVREVAISRVTAG
jgi:DNA-binding NtrC family response regulator